MAEEDASCSGLIGCSEPGLLEWEDGEAFAGTVGDGWFTGGILVDNQEVAAAPG